MQQKKWLNCIKFIAILTVIIDHTYGVLYDDYRLFYASFIGVPLFILVSGITSFWSNTRHNESLLSGTLRSCKKILTGYCIAVLIHHLYINQTFDLSVFCNQLINFSASRAHYFVAMYLQLMVTSRFLYLILQHTATRRLSLLWDVLLLGGLILFASWANSSTNIGNIYGGGGKLLGGTYLVCYFIGMLIAKYKIFESDSPKRSLFLGIGSGGLWGLSWLYMCRIKYDLIHYTPAQLGLNPPTFLLTIQSIFALLCLFGFFSLLCQSTHMNWLTNFASYIGKHTLYIFLYHDLFFAHLLLPHFFTDNVWCNRLIFLVGMIGLPVVLELGITYFAKHLRRLCTSR